jgi:hypothetical protein
MISSDKLAELQVRFQYRNDKKVDSWRILSSKTSWEGDCDDYCVTALWLLSNKSLVTFWWKILTFKAVFWLVKAPSGESHVRLHYKKFWLCNIEKEPSTENTMKKVLPFFFPEILIKLILGKLF